MASDLTNRLGGARSSLAFKAPVRCATTANITLSGFQTIDGITPAAGDTNLRILVKDQTNAVTNGIYEMSADAWSRAKDFDGSDDIVKGTRVYVPNGTANADTGWVVSTADPITIDTSSITFAAPTDEFATDAEASATAAAASATAAASSASTAAAAAGFTYVYSSSTTMADPGAGFIRFNNATLNLVTAIAIDDLSADTGNPDVSSRILTWDDSTSTNKGTLLLRYSTSFWIEFSVTGLTDNSGWTQLDVTYTGSGGSISNGNTLVSSFSRSGNKGDLVASTFTFSSSTADSDPGVGFLRLNHATPASATAIYIDNANKGGSDVSGWLDTFDDTGESAFRGHLQIVDFNSPTTSFRIYQVTGSVVDGTGYRKITIANLAGAGSFTANNDVVVSWQPRGATGVGDTTGAASSTDNAIVRFDGTGGKTLQNSAVTIDDSGNVTGAASYNHMIPHRNPMAYGAAGDGSTNDATAVESAITAALTLGGIVVIDRPHKITSRITVTPTATAQQIKIVFAGAGRIIYNPDSAAGGGFYFDGTTGSGRWDHINIENAWMTPYSGGSPDQNAWALQFFGCDRTRIMDTEIASIAGPVRSNGVLFNNCYGACLEKIYIDGLKIAIEWLNTSTHIHILDSEIVNCTVGGIYSPSGANDANCVRGCYIEGNVDPIYLVSTTEAYTVIDGNYFNDNSGSADIQHYGRRSSIVNNQFLASSALTTIKVDGAHFDVSHNYSAGGTGSDYFLRFHTNAALSIAAYNHYDGTMPAGGLFIDASSAANNLAVFNRTNTGAYPDAAPAAAGGTGLTSYTTGDLLYASSAAALSKLAAVAAGRVLTSAGTGTAPAYSTTPTLGVAGSTLGSLSMCGNVGGTVVLTPQANAGNPTLTLPNTTGTLAASAASPLSLNATTGQLSITGAALTKGDDINVTLTLGGSPSAALVAAASITAGWTGTLGVARGGTNLASYTVGDLLYASGTTTLAKLAAVATGSVLASAGTGTAPAWSTSPTLTGLTLSGSSPGMTFAGTEGSAKSFYAGESAGAFYFKNITDTGGAVVFRNSANTDTAVFNGGGAIQFPNISTTASAANLYVDNGASNNLLRSTSSSRYKRDVVDISLADVTAALQLRPIQYRSLAQADDPDRQHLGLIAEEVAAVDKRLVAFDAKGRPDGVQYERVGVLLLGLLQQHEKRIAKLEGLHD